jgi:L-lactate dehydrogenase (cytochrome)
VEVIDALKERGAHPNPNFQIFVDGGVRRASDVLKAIALGATAGRWMIRLKYAQLLLI